MSSLGDLLRVNPERQQEFHRDTGMTIDEHGTITVKVVGEETVQVITMIYNDRVAISTNPETGYDHAWCYPKGGLAMMAAQVWDPLTEDEPPLAYIKRATPGQRKAPHG